MAAERSKPVRIQGAFRPLETTLGRLLGRRLFAVAGLTLRAALRYRLVQVLVVLMFAAVAGLPAVIKHDGTASGFTQILLTYTLGAVTVLLGFANLWLGCGTLARDIEEAQIQVVAVKPIHRWEIWLGKWLGIMALNVGLLALAGVTLLGLVEWRGRQLPPEVRTELEQRVLTARGSVREPVDQEWIDSESARLFQQRLEEGGVAPTDVGLLRTQIVERVRASIQIVPSGTIRRWTLDFGSSAASLADRPLQVRTRFYAAEGTRSGTYDGYWEIGPPDSQRYRPAPTSMAPETFYEFPIPAGLIGADGVLTIDFFNFNESALLFPLEEGMEVLYPAGTFIPNFFRGLTIVLCWLGLLSAIGLAAGSFLSFPVAAFCSIAVLIVASSTGTLRQVIDEGGITGVNNNTGMVDEPNLLDRVAVLAFKGVLGAVNLVRGFSPVDSLSTGREIPWTTVLRAVLQILGLMGGLCAALGVYTFNRRELATAQGG